MDDKQILKALQDMFESVGTPLDEDAVSFALRMARDPQFHRVGSKPHQLTRAFSAASILLQAKRSPDVQTPAQLDKLLYMIREQMPNLLRPAVKQTLREVLKDLPKRPSTGRNKILTLEQEKQACDLVSIYLRNGDSMRAAYQKVADQLEVSARTVQRAWKRRGDLLEGPKAETAAGTSMSRSTMARHSTGAKKKSLSEW